MDKFHTVKKNFEFSNIIHNGKFVKNENYVIYYKDNNLDHYRFGISVSKKLGNAVQRNKYKRQVRSIIDKYKKYYQNGMDYIIIIRNGRDEFDKKDTSFKYLLDKLHQKKEK